MKGLDGRLPGEEQDLLQTSLHKFYKQLLDWGISLWCHFSNLLLLGSCSCFGFCPMVFLDPFPMGMALFLDSMTSWDFGYACSILQVSYCAADLWDFSSSPHLYPHWSSFP